MDVVGRADMRGYGISAGLVGDRVVDSCSCWRAANTGIQASRYLPRVIAGVSGRIDRLS